MSDMKKLSIERFRSLRQLIHRSARPLDFTMWKYLFENGSCKDFLSVLSSYQNEDGGFGHNIEANNWNPNSSPYTVCIALDYLDAAGYYTCEMKEAMIKHIIKYLDSGEYLTENGWVGAQGIPSNNDFSHLPWFHYDPAKAEEADIGITKRLSNLILKFAEKGSDIYKKAQAFKSKYTTDGLTLVNGVSDFDLSSFDPASFDPETWPFWRPLPVYFVGSPESEFYPLLKNVVDMNLDAIIDKLNNTNELEIPSIEEINEWERNNPHPDGKRWSTNEQTIGNYYWGTHNITKDMEILKKFNRLDFKIPV
jgi:hypothetical protein